MLPLPPTAYLVNQTLGLAATALFEVFVDKSADTIKKVALRSLLILGSYFAFFALAPLVPLYVLKVLDALTMFSLSYALYRSINTAFDRYIEPYLGLK